MAWYKSVGRENHKSLFENVEYDRCIFCGSDRTEIAIEQILQFSFQSTNTIQAASVRVAITPTQNK